MLILYVKKKKKTLITILRIQNKPIRIIKIAVTELINYCKITLKSNNIII